jgi:hypothetical protein
MQVFSILIRGGLSEESLSPAWDISRMEPMCRKCIFRIPPSSVCIVVAIASRIFIALIMGRFWSWVRLVCLTPIPLGCSSCMAPTSPTDFGWIVFCRLRSCRPARRSPRACSSPLRRSLPSWAGRLGSLSRSPDRSSCIQPAWLARGAASLNSDLAPESALRSLRAARASPRLQAPMQTAGSPWRWMPATAPLRSP